VEAEGEGEGKKVLHAKRHNGTMKYATGLKTKFIGWHIYFTVAKALWDMLLSDSEMTTFSYTRVGQKG
jgi:hypothetical protein